MPRRVAGNPGESLLEVLQRGNTPGIFADCLGGDSEYTFAPHQVPYDYYSDGVSCGQCHVLISDPYFDKTNKIPSTERKALDKLVKGATSVNSRLACCVKITPELNEMIVVVGDNESINGEWGGSKEDAF